MLKHNKKRNIGLLNEFFARYIAEAVVDFRYGDVDKAKAIWERCVANSKELNKELRLFETLYRSSLKNKDVAYDLLQKVKEDCRQQDQQKLNEEKTNLLHEVQNKLKDPDFFSRPINDYRTNATIQMMMNSWRSGGTRLDEVSKLEDQVLECMTEQKKEEQDDVNSSILSNTKEDIDKLVVNVFREKMEERYKSNLNEDQRNILGLYVFSNSKPEAKNQLTEKLTKLRDETIKQIDEEMKSNNSNSPKEQLEEIRECLLGEHYDVENLNNDTITFYLSVSNLKDELETEE